MMEANRHDHKVTEFSIGAVSGDCEAEPVPALIHQDEDDFMSESGFIDRFWLPMAAGVLLGWGSISFLLFNAFGWVVIAAIGGVAVAGLVASILLVRGGSRADIEMVPESKVESTETQYRNAA